MKLHDLFESSQEIFNVNSTGHRIHDGIISKPEEFPHIKSGIKYMSPAAAMKAMAKGQNKSLKQIIDRRMSKGGEEIIKKIASDLKSGIKYDVPVMDYAVGGFRQDGYHRLLAAQALNIKSVPIFIIHRS